MFLTLKLHKEDAKVSGPLQAGKKLQGWTVTYYFYLLKGLLQNAAALFCYPVVLPLRDICAGRADFGPNWTHRCNEKLCRQRMQKNRGCILQQPLTGSLEIFLHLILWNTFLLAAKVGAWKTLKKHLRYFIWNHYTFSPDPIIFLCIKSF